MDNMSGKVRVGLIFGGKSGEHEVSLASARSVLKALDKDKYEAVLVGVTKEGRWLMGGNPLKQLMSTTSSPLLREQNGNGTAVANGNAKEMVARDAAAITTDNALSSSVDVVFPLIHGPFGEDGTVQGLFELADIPYVGAGVAASAVGMDKALMKSIFRAEGLPIADYVVVLRHEWERSPEEVIHQIETALGYPCFVKPANLGSSVGVTKAHDWDELTQALTTAAQFDRKLIVEQAIVGREIECSVLGNDAPVASVPGEIVPGHEFYDYDAKYADESGTQLLIPANLGSSVGVTKAHNWDELTQALSTAALFDRKLVVEKAIVGREIECSVLGNDAPVASVPGEIIPGHEFYDYDAKYADESGTQLLIPADLTPEQVRTVQDLAIRAFKAIDGSGMARVDFFLQTADGKAILNEINTIPGFTNVSMYPKLWEASGLPYASLIDRLIELALERHGDKKRNRVTH